jgi:hypothetical protein
MLENPCISMKGIMYTKREFPVMFCADVSDNGGCRKWSGCILCMLC